MTRLERKLNQGLEEDKQSLIRRLLEISINKETMSLRYGQSDYSGLYMPEPIFVEFKSYMNPLVVNIVTTDPTDLPVNTAHSIQLLGEFSNHVINVSKILNAHTIHKMSVESEALSTYEFIIKHYKAIHEIIRLSPYNLNIQVYKILAGNKQSLTQTYEEEQLFKTILNYIRIEEEINSESFKINQILGSGYSLYEGENINRLCRSVGLNKITFIVKDEDFFSCDKKNANIIVTFSTKMKCYMIKTCSYYGLRLYEYKAEYHRPKYLTDNGVKISEYTPLEIELSQYINEKAKYIEFTPNFTHLDNFKCTANTKLREWIEYIQTF